MLTTMVQKSKLCLIVPLYKPSPTSYISIRAILCSARTNISIVAFVNNREKAYYANKVKNSFYVETKDWKRRTVHRGLMVFFQVSDMIMYSIPQSASTLFCILCVILFAGFRILEKGRIRPQGSVRVLLFYSNHSACKN